MLYGEEEKKIFFVFFRFQFDILKVSGDIVFVVGTQIRLYTFFGYAFLKAQFKRSKDGFDNWNFFFQRF
jgi:hypothetical protein